MSVPKIHGNQVLQLQGNSKRLSFRVSHKKQQNSRSGILAGGRGQLVGSAVRMIRAIVTSLPVKRGILPSLENGADDFATSNDFCFSSQAPDGVCFLAE